MHFLDGTSLQLQVVRFGKGYVTGSYRNADLEIRGNSAGLPLARVTVRGDGHRDLVASYRVLWCEKVCLF